MQARQYTPYFARQWGAKEGAARVQPSGELPIPDQSAFDRKFSDVAGLAGARYFLLEFGASRAAFAEDVSAAALCHRQHIVQFILDDARGEQLSLACHYAAYPDATNHFAFEPYVLATCPPRPKVGQRQTTSRASVGFEGFHGYVTRMGSRASEELPGLYELGYGLPYASFVEYAAYLHQLLSKGMGGWGEALLGVYEPRHKSLTMFTDTFEKLITSVSEAVIARTRVVASDDTSATQSTSPAID